MTSRDTNYATERDRVSDVIERAAVRPDSLPVYDDENERPEAAAARRQADVDVEPTA